MSVFRVKNKAFDVQNCAFRGRFLLFGPYVKKYSNPKFLRFWWLFFPSGRKNFFLVRAFVFPRQGRKLTVLCCKGNFVPKWPGNCYRGHHILIILRFSVANNWDVEGYKWGFGDNKREKWHFGASETEKSHSKMPKNGCFWGKKGKNAKERPPYQTLNTLLFNVLWRILHFCIFAKMILQGMSPPI